MKKQSSSEQCHWDCTARLATMWTMDLGILLHHAETALGRFWSRFWCVTFGCPIVVQTPRACSVQAYDLKHTRGSNDATPKYHVFSAQRDTLEQISVLPMFIPTAVWMPTCPGAFRSITASCACGNAVSPNQFVAPPNAFRQCLEPFCVGSTTGYSHTLGNGIMTSVQPWLHIQIMHGLNSSRLRCNACSMEWIKTTLSCVHNGMHKLRAWRVHSSEAAEWHDHETISAPRETSLPLTCSRVLQTVGGEEILHIHTEPISTMSW